MNKNDTEKKHILSTSAVVLMLVLTLIIGVGFYFSGNTTYQNFKNAFLGGDPEVQEATIKIGVYECLSGEYKQYGKEEAAGVELAHELYPTVLGKNIELVYADNRSNMYDAETALQELMAQNPSVVIGSYGDVLSLVAGDYMVAASTPAITVTSINPLITANNDFYFTASFSIAKQGSALAEYAFTGLNKTSFATVKAQRDDSSTEIIRRFRIKIRSLAGGNSAFAGDVVIDAEAADFSSSIQQLKDSGADAVLLAIPPAVAQTFMTQAAEQGYLPLFLGTREWDTPEFEEFLRNNPDLTVSYPSVQAADSTQVYSVFKEAYYNKYGENAEEPSGGMAAAFDAYLLARQAIENAYADVMSADLETMRTELSGDAKGRAIIKSYEDARETGIPKGTHIRDALKNIDGFEGATGILNYSGSTEVSKSVTILHFFMGEKLEPYVVD